LRPEDTVITRRQLHAVMADGARVVDTAGHPMGRIVDVVLDVRTMEPVYMTVACVLHTGATGILPLRRARLVDGAVRVPCTAADICGAPHAEAPASPPDRQRADTPLRPPNGGRAAAPPGLSAPRTPMVAGNGHRPAGGAAAGSPRVVDGVHALPVVAGLDVHGGDGGPVAYPATLSGPWPPVSTSSSGPPWWQRRQWRWRSIPTSVRAMRRELRTVLDMTGLPDDELDDLILAAGEAGANAVEHAQMPTLPFFDVLSEVGERRAHVVIQDHGRWRHPTAGGDRGRGLHMIGHLTDATLTIGARGTTVVLRSRRRASH
jgi:anti-sigma regulatory factor (Ser/Thr protein kinase)